MSGIIGPISNLVNSDYTPSNNVVNTNQPIAVQEEMDNKPKVVQNAGEATEKKMGRRSSPAECETCKHRKYQDGSDENVSFKSASHISPESSGARVMAHEQEHVSNAYTKAAQNNGKVLSAVVSLHTAICPECGRSYVAGGTTSTKIKYLSGDDGYSKAINNANDAAFNGKNVDYKG